MVRGAAVSFGMVLLAAVGPAPSHAEDAGADADKSGYTLFNPTPDWALRSLETDRPTKSTVPFTVDAGHFQYETDAAIYGFTDTQGVKTRSWTVLDPVLKLGLTNRVDAEMQITSFQTVKTSTAAGSQTASGFGDVYFRLKGNLVGDDRGDVAVALVPYVKVPTASRNLGNGRVEGGLVLPVGLNAPAGFSVILMGQGDYLANASGRGYHGALDFLVNVNHPVGKQLAVFAELFTTQPLQQGDGPIYTADFAVTYAMTSTIQLDIGANLGLNAAARGCKPIRGCHNGFSSAAAECFPAADVQTRLTDRALTDDALCHQVLTIGPDIVILDEF